MTSEKLKPTPGRWLFGDWPNNKLGEVDEAGWVDVWARLPDGTRSLPVISCRHQQQIENARFIAEAGTVFHECGLSPRELLEVVRDLQTAISDYLSSQDALDNREYHGINAEPHDTLMRRRNYARDDLDSALTKLPLEEAQSQLVSRADELAKHLRDAHAFIENTEAFGHRAGYGILECGGCSWNIDESKAALAKHKEV